MPKDIQVDIKGLKDLIKAIGGNPKVRVGILDNGADRRDDGKSNATIGSFHEFGLGVPQRSFLRQPLIDGIGPAVEAAVNEQDVINIKETKSLVPLIMKIGRIGEAVVREAFDAEGHGKWKKHSAGYENNTGMILQDTQQLRDSITSAVSDDA